MRRLYLLIIVCYPDRLTARSTRRREDEQEEEEEKELYRRSYLNEIIQTVLFERDYADGFWGAAAGEGDGRAGSLL